MCKFYKLLNNNGLRLVTNFSYRINKKRWKGEYEFRQKTTSSKDKSFNKEWPILNGVLRIAFFESQLISFECLDSARYNSYYLISFRIVYSKPIILFSNRINCFQNRIPNTVIRICVFEHCKGWIFWRFGWNNLNN